MNSSEDVKALTLSSIVISCENTLWSILRNRIMLNINLK